MADLTTTDVLQLAHLARLDLSAEEIERFCKEINGILHFVDQLREADTEGLEPTTQVTGLVNVMREDSVRDYGVSGQDLLKLAPHTQDDQLKVKRMIG